MGLPDTRDLTFIAGLSRIPAGTLNNIQDDIVALFGSGFGQYGDGSDGNATLDGVNTFAWATLASGTYTLNRDVALNNLTITGTAKLDNGGFKVAVAGILDTTGTSLAGGAVNADGANGSGATGGAA